VSQKRVLVSGISGFLGHHITKACQSRGFDVVGVDKRPIPENHILPNKFLLTDINDLKFRDLMGIDYIIHLGWRTNIPDCQRHPEQSTTDNIDMSVHLLEVAREAKVKKFLFPSTASLYGNNPTPWAEDLPANPIEPYSWQKLAIEQACKMYSSVYNLPTVVFRFFQIFGELQREDTALAAFLKAKIEGRPLTLTETVAQSSFRSGQRDFIYAGDVAEALMLAIESDETGNGEIFNVSSGTIHTMEEIAKAIGAEVVWIPRREYEVERHLGDITKIKRVLNWQPKVDVIGWLENYTKGLYDQNN